MQRSVSLVPPLPPAVPPSGAPPLREHDLRGLSAVLSLVAGELGRGDVRSRVLGARVARACAHLVSLCGPDPAERGGATLGAVIEDAVVLAGGLARRSTRISADCAVDAPCGAAGHDLFRILVHLLAGSVQAVNERGGGRVSLSARELGGDVVLHLLDDGGALLPDGVAPGRMGLGLVVAEALTARLGGRLWALRSNCAGTALRVTLPARALAAAEGGNRTAAAGKSSGHAPGEAGARSEGSP